MSKEKISYSDAGYNKLLALRIDPKIIKAAGLQEQEYTRIASLLAAPMNPYLLIVPFKVTEPWQLQALSSTVSFETLSPNAADECGAGLAHYAAWSCNLEALEWIKINQPRLITKTTKDGRTIAHFAADSGQAGALEWIRMNFPQLLSRQSKNGNTIVNHATRTGNLDALIWIDLFLPELMKGDVRKIIALNAAFSGNANMLEWIRQLDPSLLNIVSISGRTIAHHAAWSGNVEALDWIRKFNPSLLELKCNAYRNIAHFAAWSGRADVLEWIRAHAPRLLKQETKLEYNIAHYAALSGCSEAFEWIRFHFPSLLLKHAHKKSTIAHFAASSNQPEAFNRALQYTTNPQQFIYGGYSKSINNDQILQCINQAMDDNLSLVSVEFPKELQTDAQVHAIRQKVSRNQAIPRAMNSFAVCMLSEHYSRIQAMEEGLSVPQELPFEIWKMILVHLLPTDISDKKINQLFCRAYLTVKQAIALDLVKCQVEPKRAQDTVDDSSEKKMDLKTSSRPPLFFSQVDKEATEHPQTAENKHKI